MNTTRTLVAAAIAAGAALSSAQAQTMIGGGGKAAPSFPITISQPGSYKLAGNLNVPAGVSAIVVTAANVTLDLGGYSIIGGNQCSGGWSAMSCTGSTTSVGIDAHTPNLVSITNGQVSGFGIGVRLGFGSTAADLRVSNMAIYGIVAQTGSTVRSTNVFYVKGTGIAASEALVEHVNVGYTPTAISAQSGLVIGSVISNVLTGIVDVGYGMGVGPSLRETHVQALGAPFSGNVRSLGNNSCNGSLC
jgi:hypothetical protein